MIINFEQLGRQVFLFAVGLFLRVDSCNDVIYVEGKLHIVETLWIVFTDAVKKFFQIIVLGKIPDRCLDRLHISVGAKFKPTEPGFYILLPPRASWVRK